MVDASGATMVDASGILLHYSSKHKLCEQPLAHLKDRRSDTQTQTGTILFFIKEKDILKTGTVIRQQYPLASLLASVIVSSFAQERAVQNKLRVSDSRVVLIRKNTWPS
jgi:hypothetical protein